MDEYHSTEGSTTQWHHHFEILRLHFYLSGWAFGLVGEQSYSHLLLIVDNDIVLIVLSILQRRLLSTINTSHSLIASVYQHLKCFKIASLACDMQRSHAFAILYHCVSIVAEKKVDQGMIA